MGRTGDILPEPIALDALRGYRMITDSRRLRAAAAAIFLACAAAAAPGYAVHSADTEMDWSISLSELLRTIQLFNLGEFGCAQAGDDKEDGFEIGAAIRDCGRHSADFQPPYWRLTLSELLRLIQFYNAGGFGVDCTEDDGFSLSSLVTEGELLSTQNFAG